MQEKLGLSYHNIRGMHKLVDSIPERAEWHSRHLSFKDRPDDKHLIQFRNPLDAIRSLWGDPAHAKNLVYAPRKIFSDANRRNRIYTEMWTGKWWHAIQVRYSLWFPPDFAKALSRTNYLQEPLLPPSSSLPIKLN